MEPPKKRTILLQIHLKNFFKTLVHKTRWILSDTVKSFDHFLKKIIFHLLPNMVLRSVLNAKYKNKVHNLSLASKLHDSEKRENFEENKKPLWGNFLDKSLHDVTWPPEPFLTLSLIQAHFFSFLWLLSLP